jgi:uncharacterized repeat protein (TIGR03803 family)
MEREMDMSLRACGRVAAACWAVAFAAFSNCGASAAPVNIVYAFNDASDGVKPVAQFFDSKGNLYGFTIYGGDSSVCPTGCGTIFKIAPDGTKTVLHAFTANPDGATPIGIVRDAKGNIFGATVYGGQFGYGTVFKLFPNGREKVLHSFKAENYGRNSPHGMWPQAGPTIGVDGNLYGTTGDGGTRATGCGQGGCGTVYKLTLGGKLTTLYKFKGPGDGCQAYSGLTTDRSGNLYGVTNGCGGDNSGTVYKIDPSGNETILHTFTEGADGSGPVAPPTIDKDGTLYGDTEFGGGGEGCNGTVGCGIIYKITADGTYSIFYTFPKYVDGFSPMGNLYIDKTGDLYGTTYEGGAFSACNHPYGCGTVFKLSPDATLTTLHEFMGPGLNDGALVPFGVIPGPSSKQFYGSTMYGPGCCGMVFSIDK